MGFWDNLGNMIRSWFGLGNSNIPLPNANVPAPNFSLDPPSPMAPRQQTFTVTPINDEYVSPVNPILAAAQDIGSQVSKYSHGRYLDPATAKYLADCSYYVGLVANKINPNINPADVTTATMKNILTPENGFEYVEGTQGVQPGDILWYGKGYKGRDTGHTAIMGEDGKLHQVGGGRNPTEGRGYWYGDTDYRRFQGYFRPTNLSALKTQPVSPSGSIPINNNPVTKQDWVNDDWIMGLAMDQMAKNNPLAKNYLTLMR